MLKNVNDYNLDEALILINEIWSMFLSSGFVNPAKAEWPISLRSRFAMPTSYPALRKKFMSEHTDGTDIAEEILFQGGARIESGVIYAPEIWCVINVTYGDLLDARDFLCDEFDYRVVEHSNPL